MRRLRDIMQKSLLVLEKNETNFGLGRTPYRRNATAPVETLCQHDLSLERHRQFLALLRNQQVMYVWVYRCGVCGRYGQAIEPTCF